MSNIEDIWFVSTTDGQYKTITPTWEFQSLGWSTSEGASQLLDEYFSYASSGFFASKTIKSNAAVIPVLRHFRQEDDVDAQHIKENATQLRLGRLRIIMGFLNQHTSEKSWLGAESPEEYSEHIPRLFVRDDATAEDQISGLLSLVYSGAPSQQLARELASERLVGEMIRKIFGPHCPYWTSVPQLVDSDMTARHGCLPLVFFLLGDPDMSGDAVMTARQRMAGALHRTLTFLVLEHHKGQGWRLDRELTESDYSVQLNESFFVFSVLYSRQFFRVDVNFPVIHKSASTQRYEWRFINAAVMERKCKAPLDADSRLAVLQALLFIEQHICLLKEELRVAM
ncbi:uncharacterized protein B0H18DRAFT_1208019 [Fomitopsis serialis]|uniref:uncharacterized protein n=1 Tax=Fomitopsis serialis TaxID=139415 RepID=UPI002008668D|nr:uncharacterized protein B0H18DRAFT_1208019 [Neoantrodia serialis]KAH9933926.1 hypothetical protein B0H18DRAFT_1208019 [Neoantrodia serialis]